MLCRFLLAIGALVAHNVEAFPKAQLPPPGVNISEYAVTSLPNIDFSIPKSWAGELPVGSGYGNDFLFFWLWQAESSTANEHLIIWFNGGPACSSMLGLFKENGPIIFPSALPLPEANPYSWTRLANILYVDQPVGTGFSQGNRPATSNAADTAAFVQWLGNFLNKFPALKSKKIHLIGESFAGIFIPYIAQAIQQQNASLGIHITSIGLGDATWGNPAAMTDVVATTFIKDNLASYGTNMPQEILSVLEQADVDCGFKALLSQVTYPPNGKYHIPGNPENSNYKRNTPPPGYDPAICDFTNGTQTVEQMRFLINGTSCYHQCATYDAAQNYFFDVPGRCFNIYNIDTNCSNPLYRSDDTWQAYLNLPNVQKALHIGPSIKYAQCNNDLTQVLASEIIVPPAYSILPDLLSSGIIINIWAGALDFLINPLGIELSIQNMTWSGAQGFKQKPATRWYDLNNDFAGTYGTERGLGYYIFQGAGHRTGQDKPVAAFTFVQNRVVNNRALPSKKGVYQRGK